MHVLLKTICIICFLKFEAVPALRVCRVAEPDDFLSKLCYCSKKPKETCFLKIVFSLAFSFKAFQRVLLAS